jgi:hypothetical protein
MDDRAVFTLFGFLQDDTTAFDVTVAADDYVSRLKKPVYEQGKNGVLCDADAKDLSL